MTSYELELQVEQQNELRATVIRLSAEGKKPGEIKALTGLSAMQQREIMDEFRRIARSSEYIDQRSKEIMAYSDVHFNSVIRGLYEVLEEAKFNNDFKLSADILSKIAAVEAKRLEFLQKAGIINDKGVGEQVAKMEAQRDALVNILKEAKTKFPEASKWIRDQLLSLNGGTPSERVDG